MSHSIAALTTLGILTLVGCGDESVPEDDVGSKTNLKNSNITTRIHIDGFKKSKSGAT